MSIRKFGTLDKAASLAQLAAIIEHWCKNDFGLFAVFESGSGEFAGECGIRWLEDGSDVELSYGLRPRFQGRGYATEASLAVLHHGFATLGLPRILARSRGDNHGSHRVLEKCGMRLEWRRNTGSHDLVQYGMLRTPYRTTVKSQYRCAYPNPIRLAAGEQVSLGGGDDEFPGWIWTIRGDGQCGWAPVPIFERAYSESTTDTQAAKTNRDYDATELDVEPGDPVRVLELLGGWARVEAQPHAYPTVGWVPQACLEQPTAERETGPL